MGRFLTSYKHTSLMKTNFFSIATYCALAFSILACSPNNVIEKNAFKQHLDNQHVEGSFCIYDNASATFSVYNLKRYRDSAFQPAATFHIVSALVALETGKISNEKTLIEPDKSATSGVGKTNEAVYQKQSLASAFSNSSTACFQKVAKSLGKDTFRFWLDSLKYGTRDLTGPIDSFWMDNSLRVTPDEQLGLVKKLYFKQLPFQKRSQEIVGKMMLQASDSNYTLAYKTGAGKDMSGKNIGWAVGWIEENRHPYFFVLNIGSQSKEADLDQKAKLILTDILKEEGFFLGKK